MASGTNEGMRNMKNSSTTQTMVTPVVTDAVVFEPFHGFPQGLKIHIVDTARLTSLGNQMVTAGDDGSILDIDKLTATQPADSLAD